MEENMPAPLPIELRERVVAAYEDGAGSYREIVERFGVGEASASRWMSLKRRTGSLEPRKAGGATRQRLIDAAGEAYLVKLLTSMADRTLGELCVAYDEHLNVKVSPQTMSVTLRRMGFTRKKGSFVR